MTPIPPLTASQLIRAGIQAPCHPWPRYALSPDAWRSMAAALPAEPGLAFLALWADTHHVHALFHAGAPLIASVPVEAGLYAALSPARPGATLFERAVSDLWGHQAADAADTRPWLDHGAWTILRPLSERPVPNAGAPEVPEMLDHAVEQLGFGPLPPVWSPPAHWRVHLDPATPPEARFGYAHRGIVGLMRGKSPQGAARLAARIDASATCAHAAAFARAVEAALGTQVPPRATALRTAMILIERIAVALHDLHATAEALALPAPRHALAREHLLQACEAAFGHRFMMDRITPGGVQSGVQFGEAELTPEGTAILHAALDAIDLPPIPFPPAIGTLSTAEAWRLSPGGIAARAAATPDPTAPAAPTLPGGDLAARMTLRTTTLARDIHRAKDTLATLPEGIAWIAPGHDTAEGLGTSEGPAGHIYHWVSLAGGIIAACFAADPAWLTLPAAESAMRGAPLAHLPAIAASFALRPQGMDL